MYNRYIPQPDGSYRRSRVSEPRPCAPTPPPKLPQPRPEPPRQSQPKPEPPCTPPPPNPPQHQNHGVFDFIKQLMPKDFDTGDFIVVLLLLLLAGDCEDDRSTALLTLALYILM